MIIFLNFVVIVIDFLFKSPPESCARGSSPVLSPVPTVYRATTEPALQSAVDATCAEEMVLMLHNTSPFNYTHVNVRECVCINNVCYDICRII